MYFVFCITVNIFFSNDESEMCFGNVSNWLNKMLHSIKLEIRTGSAFISENVVLCLNKQLNFNIHIENEKLNI